MATEALAIKAKKLRSLKDKKERLEAELTEVNKIISNLADHEIPRMMEDQEITKFSVDGVGTIYLSHSAYAYIRVDDIDVAYAWLRKRGHGALIKETIHHSTLRSFVKEQMEEGIGLPDFFNAKPITTASLRRK